MKTLWTYSVALVHMLLPTTIILLQKPYSLSPTCIFSGTLNSLHGLLCLLTTAYMHAKKYIIWHLSWLFLIVIACVEYLSKKNEVKSYIYTVDSRESMMMMTMISWHDYIVCSTTRNANIMVVGGVPLPIPLLHSLSSPLSLSPLESVWVHVKIGCFVRTLGSFLLENVVVSRA